MQEGKNISELDQSTIVQLKGPCCVSSIQQVFEHVQANRSVMNGQPMRMQYTVRELNWRLSGTTQAGYPIRLSQTCK